MIFTALSIQSVRLDSSLATGVSAPPAHCTAKPKMIAATIRGSMALRLHSAVKSGTVKKFTIISAADTLPTSPSGGSYAPVTSGITRQTAYITTAAMAAVTRNVTRVAPMIFPARRIPFMLAMAEAMEQNTMGTATQNIILMKTVPNGSRQVAPGQAAPTAHPATIAISILRMNQYCFRNFFIGFAPFKPAAVSGKRTSKVQRRSL